MTPQQTAELILESAKTMTTATIVRQFRESGDYALLEPALEFLPRGEAMALADVLNVRLPKFRLIERIVDENRDVLQSLLGGE